MQFETSYSSLKVGDRHTFRTWELLSIKMISKVVDEASTAGLDVERCIETDTIKRLVQSYLPKFPTECRLPNNLKVLEIHYKWDYDPSVETNKRNFPIEVPTSRDPHLVGDSFWVRYGWKDWEGIVRVQINRIVSQVEDKFSDLVVDILEEISYDRFCDYFETNSYHGEMDVSAFDEHVFDDWDVNYEIILWREDNGQEIGVYLGLEEDTDGAITERIYKQVDGTWCHVYSHKHSSETWMLGSAGRSFLSEERVKAIIKTWTDKGIELHNLSAYYIRAYFL